MRHVTARHAGSRSAGGRLVALLLAVLPAVLSAQEGVTVDPDAPQPDYVVAAERGGSPYPSPMLMPDGWRLAFVDVETTGLVAGYHEVTDIGVVVTDLEGVVLDSLYLLVQPDHPERLSLGAYAIAAFNAERWERLGALSNGGAVDSLTNALRRMAGGRPLVMVSYNSHFDAAFLDQLFRTAGRNPGEVLHWSVLDIPSMAWALGVRDLTQRMVSERLDVRDESWIAEEHTGLAGAQVNARIYAALVREARALGIPVRPPLPGEAR